MIPPEHKTERLIHLESIVASLGDITKLHKLERENLYLMGAYIQIYNFIEMNVRRSIEVFAHAGLLPADIEKKHHKLPPVRLIPTLKEQVTKMDVEIEDIPVSIGKLDEIEYRRGFRNIFAHWAALKIPDEDAIFCFTKDGKDEKQVSGENVMKFGYVRTAILDLADIRGLALHMSQYEHWIAHKTSEWHKRYLPEIH